MAKVWTNQKQRRVKALGLITLLAAATGQAHAKHIDSTPDITSDAFWDANHIAAVRVTARGKDAKSRDYIAYQLETQLSDGPIERTRTVPVSHLWFGEDAGETPPLAVNDRIILIYAKHGPGPIVATHLDIESGDSQSWNALVQIARLRANRADLPAYMERVLSSDAIVSSYCLKHLLEQTGVQAPRGYMANLLRLRDEESRGVRVRILANRLADRLAGRLDFSDEEYGWLRTSLVRSRIDEWTELLPFVDRLLEFENKRPESVEFFAQVTLDAGAADAIRIAAYSTLEDPRMFNSETPDAVSERIFQTCLQMVQDRAPAIRGAGAALLHNLSMRVNPGDRAAYLERSRTAIGEALAAENDETAREQLDYYRGLMSE
jgi:hypothetical protein